MSNCWRPLIPVMGAGSPNQIGGHISVFCRPAIRSEYISVCGSQCRGEGKLAETAEAGGGVIDADHAVSGLERVLGGKTGPRPSGGKTRQWPVRSAGSSRRVKCRFGGGWPAPCAGADGENFRGVRAKGHHPFGRPPLGGKSPWPRPGSKMRVRTNGARARRGWPHPIGALRIPCRRSEEQGPTPPVVAHRAGVQGRKKSQGQAGARQETTAVQEKRSGQSPNLRNEKPNGKPGPALGEFLIQPPDDDPDRIRRE